MKYILIILFIVYLLTGLWGFVDLGRLSYYDLDGFKNYTQSQILLRIIVAMVMVLISWGLYKNYAPEKYEKGKAKWSFRFLLPVLLTAFFIIMNTGLLLPWNRLDQQAEIRHVAGFVVKTDVTRSAKGRRQYAVTVADTIARRYYRFAVRKKVYNNWTRRDVFVKDMRVGRFGIIYREEE